MKVLLRRFATDLLGSTLKRSPGGLAAFILFTLTGGALVSAQETAPFVMLSDIHFDPFADPGKAIRLAATPIEDWKSILKESPTAGQPAAFAALQAACEARGEDTNDALLTASMREVGGRGAGALFVTVSGDLLVHGFECRYRKVMKGEEGYRSFAAKAARYVITRIKDEFPHVPIYVALGNNDSACGDYRIDLRDEFLSAVSSAVLEGIGANVARRRSGKRDVLGIAGDFEARGSYRATLPGVAKTRLLVVNDVYLARAYSTCSGEKIGEGAASTLKWLEQQLGEARREHERVWIMGHIPPGVDVYHTVAHLRDVCGSDKPEMFLGSDALGTLIARYEDVVTLGIFGHTHMDEVRVLKGKEGSGVPLKLVPSVSPVDGNHPSFTIGEVDTGTGTLRDYAVFVSPDMLGTGTWLREYAFGETYGYAGFSGAVLTSMIADFERDGSGEGVRSRAYQREFFAGGESPLRFVWPQAVCALDHVTPAEYKRCVCPSQDVPAKP